MVCDHECLIGKNSKKIYSLRGECYDVYRWYLCANCYKNVDYYKYMNKLNETNKLVDKKSKKCKKEK